MLYYTNSMSMKSYKAYSQIFLALALAVIAVLLATQFPKFQSFFKSSVLPTDSNGPIANRATITADDNGKIFTYPLTSRFTLLLDKTQYPPGKLFWTPETIIGKISNVQASESPNLIPTRFEAAQPGTTVIRNNDFSVTIIVTTE